jgi:hypothetical protein
MHANSTGLTCGPRDEVLGVAALADAKRLERRDPFGPIDEGRFAGSLQLVNERDARAGDEKARPEAYGPHTARPAPSQPAAPVVARGRGLQDMHGLTAESLGLGCEVLDKLLADRNGVIDPIERDTGIGTIPEARHGLIPTVPKRGAVARVSALKLVEVNGCETGLGLC